MNQSLMKKWVVNVGCFTFLALLCQQVFAVAPSLGGMASSIAQSFVNLAKLITAGSYLAGLGFSIGAILKFKQHKDNPTQVTIGQPIALVFISAALLFLPSILGMTGSTMFGPAGGEVAGPAGMLIGNPKQ